MMDVDGGLWWLYSLTPEGDALAPPQPRWQRLPAASCRLGSGAMAFPMLRRVMAAPARRVSAGPPPSH